MTVYIEEGGELNQTYLWWYPLLELCKSPFADTEVDYFTPMNVKRGVVTEKSRGCLFTCLTTRPLHLELDGDLSIESYTMPLRIFHGRRESSAFKRSKKILTNNIWNKSYLDLRVISNELILAGKLQLKKLQKKKPEKYSGFDGAWTRASRILIGRSTNCSYEATCCERGKF